MRLTSTAYAFLLLACTSLTARAETVDVGGDRFDLPVPAGYCALDRSNPSDARMTALMEQAAVRTRLKPLLHFIDCDQLKQIRAGDMIPPREGGWETQLNLNGEIAQYQGVQPSFLLDQIAKGVEVAKQHAQQPQAAPPVQQEQKATAPTPQQGQPQPPLVPMTIKVVDTAVLERTPDSIYVVTRLSNNAYEGERVVVKGSRLIGTRLLSIALGEQGSAASQPKLLHQVKELLAAAKSSASGAQASAQPR